MKVHGFADEGYPRLSIAIYLPNPLDYYGGGERLAILFANAFQEEGIDTVVYADSTSHGNSRVPAESLKGLLRVPYHLIPYTRIHPLGTEILSQPRPPTSLLEQYDLNLLFTQRLPEGKFIRAVRDLGVRVVFLCHGVTAEPPSIGTGLFFWYNLYLRIVLLWNWRSYSTEGIYFQVLNPQTAKLFIRFGVPRQRIYLIPNGFDAGPVCPGRNDDEFSVLFIGRLEDRQKGIRRLIRTVRHLHRSTPSIRVRVVGEGTDSRLVRIAAQKLPNLEYVGKVDDRLKLELLETASLMLITSNGEPFPIVAIEGLKAGLPLISTPTSGPRYLVGLDSRFGTANTYHARALAGQITSYFNRWKLDKAKYYETKLQIAQRAESLFDQRQMLEHYVAMVRNVTHPPPTVTGGVYGGRKPLDRTRRF